MSKKERSPDGNSYCNFSINFLHSCRPEFKGLIEKHHQLVNGVFLTTETFKQLDRDYT